jgi:hypothetical protein
MDGLDWIKDVPILTHPCIIFLNKEKTPTNKGNGELQHYLFKNGYKTMNGQRKIDVSKKVGFVIKEGNKKRFTPLQNYFSVFNPQSYNNYNIYYWEDIKGGNYVSNEKVVVYKSTVYDGWYTFKEGLSYKDEPDPRFWKKL